MHAVLLAGIGLSARHAPSPAPVYMTVSLVSFHMETSPTKTSRRDGASPLTPATPPAGASVKFENSQRSEPASGHVATADPESPEFPLDEHETDMEQTHETVSEKTKTTMVLESTVKPDDGEKLAPITGDAFQEDKTANWGQEGSPVYAGGFASQLQTSKLSNIQTRFLASSGDPSSFGGIFGTAHEAVFSRAELLNLPEPVYPIVSRKRGEEGTVVVEVTVGAQGGVQGAQVAASSTHPRLDQAALDAARSVRFSPATVDGRPVDSERTVAYTFRLE